MILFAKRVLENIKKFGVNKNLIEMYYSCFILDLQSFVYCLGIQRVQNIQISQSVRTNK